MATRRGRGEGGIRLRKDGRYEGTVELPTIAGERRRKSVYGRTKAEVRDKMRALVRTVEDGKPLPSHRLRLGVYLHHWLDNIVDTSTLAKSTRDDYRYLVVRYIEPHLGAITIAVLTADDIYAWTAQLRRAGLSDRTVQYGHSVLRNALGHAQRVGSISHNPAALVKVPRPKRDPSKVFAWTPEECAALLAAAPTARYGAMFIVCAVLGLRPGEARAIRWCDISFSQNTLRVEQCIRRGGVIHPLPKTLRSRRALKMPEIVCETLEGQRRSHAATRLAAGGAWVDNDLVFPSAIGSPIDARNLTRAFKNLREKSGLRPGRLYNLRHSAATFMLVTGVDISVVSAMLGHSSLSITSDTYLHVLPVLTEDAAHRIDAAYAALAQKRDERESDAG